MKTILEYLSTKVTQTKIKATDETIGQIIKDELDRLGHDADLNHIDVSKVTDMKGLFDIYGLDNNYKDLNPDISQWDVSKVENMNGMFSCCKNFNQDISSWNVSKVEDMRGMFWNCENFNQDLSQWNVDKVKDHFNMFYGCPIKQEFKPKFNI